MTARISTSAAAVAAVMVMLLGVLAVPPSASAASTDLSSRLQTEQGTTTILGGGDHFFVKFGADAAFGIVWGTNDTPNNVYFVAIKARYLGVAQVYDDDGNLVQANHTVKIYTLYAVKLEDILEFNDSDASGTLPYYRVYSSGNFTGDYISFEPLYKSVDLKTAWTASPITSADTDTTRTWSFSLSAKNLSYTPLDDYTGPTGDDNLNEFNLTFHLEARMVQIDNATIPQWRITVTRGMMGNMMWFSNAERAPDLIMSGKMLTYNVKWDSSIQGWDFDADAGNPALVLEFGAIVGNYIPPAMATWMETRMIQAMNEEGVMNCRSGETDVNVNSSTGVYITPRSVTTPSLTFGGEKTRIGRFEWVANVSVDGVQNHLHAQLMAGVPIWAVGANGALFRGFGVIGGIAYPGGNSIVHDPTFTSEALIDLGSKTNVFPVGVLVVGLIVAVVVIVVAVVLVLGEKKPGQKGPQNYERSRGSQPGEWAKYYNKK
jgi:hypothetical protein